MFIGTDSLRLWGTQQINITYIHTYYFEHKTNEMKHNKIIS